MKVQGLEYIAPIVIMCLRTHNNSCKLTTTAAIPVHLVPSPFEGRLGYEVF